MMNTCDDDMSAENPPTVLMSQTQMYSKCVPVDVADAVSHGFADFLKNECDLDHMLDNITLAGDIGTLHWFDAKLDIPDKSGLKPEEMPIQRNVRVLEIRKYNRQNMKDNRIAIITSTNFREFEKVSDKIASFYANLGYEKLAFGGPGSKQFKGNGIKF